MTSPDVERLIGACIASASFGVYVGYEFAMARIAKIAKRAAAKGGWPPIPRSLPPRPEPPPAPPRKRRALAS